MSTQPIVPEEQNQLQGLVDSFSKLSPLFGSGTKTETSTTAPSAGANANADTLLAQLQGGVDPKYLDDLQNQIFDQARQKIAPELMNSVSAGNRAYSDTSLQDFASRATGYATAASAQAKLEAITKNNSLMTQVVDSQLKANKTQTSSTTTSASPAGKGLQIAGVALGGYSAAKKAYDSITGKKKQGTTPPTSNPFGTEPVNEVTTDVGTGGSSIGGTTATTGNVEGGFDASTGASGAVSQGSTSFADSSNFLTEAANEAVQPFNEFTTFGSEQVGGGSGGNPTVTSDGVTTNGDPLSADTTNTLTSPDIANENLLDLSGSSSGDLGDVAYDTGANLIDNFGSSVSADVPFDVGENLISSFGGADLGGELAANAGLDIGFPYLAAANLAGHVLGINEISEPLDALSGAVGGVVDAVGDGLGDVAGGIGDALGSIGEAVTGGSSIVCYELVRTGGMQKEHADISSAYAKKLPQAVVRGYHHMCPWLLSMMHKHKWAYKVLQKCAIARSLELESSNLFGKVVRAVFEPICWVVGVTAAKNAPLQLNIQKFLIKNALLYDLPKDS